jgi:selenide,water dikinase
MAVTGVVHPDRILKNSGAEPGDALVLTKPLGTGVIFNANRAGKFSPEALDEILPVVAALNKVAMETALKYDVHGMTDITGFGFAGHALEMAVHSGVRMKISFTALPVYEGAVNAPRWAGKGSRGRSACGRRALGGPHRGR